MSVKVKTWTGRLLNEIMKNIEFTVFVQCICYHINLNNYRLKIKPSFLRQEENGVKLHK